MAAPVKVRAAYVYPDTHGRVTAAVVLDAMLDAGASYPDMVAALVQAMPDRYAGHAAKALGKAKQHVSFLRAHGGDVQCRNGVFTCPDAKGVQTRARGGFTQ
jgi:hypothetical protein